MKTKTNHGSEIALENTAPKGPEIYFFSDDREKLKKAIFAFFLHSRKVARAITSKSNPLIFKGIHPGFIVAVMDGETLPPSLRESIIAAGGEFGTINC